ncbi:Rosmarinate synthase [Cytospora mali]|uniref:Rosmarinate synthase n=1 Tax=Cytospora mali TaxID=578113 RepID=A0A194UMD9_CYTMA|nr:Rosmarinate synthase [Valsa mali var. pyri (nom. inval.)]
MTDDQSPPASRVISSRRIFPATAKPAEQATTTRLSIADATVVRFTPCAAVWLYERSEKSQDSGLLLDHLELSLRQTLDSFPHFAGQLRWATQKDVEPWDLNPRCLGRPVVSYGTADDPGVGLVLAEHDRDLSDVVPGAEERKTSRKTWVATDFPQDELLPGLDLAFGPSMAQFEGLPGVAVQITRFRCGGFAVGVTTTHCLADAVCLMQFVHSWAERSRLLFEWQDAPHGHDGLASRRPEPVFDPELLDRHAGLAGGAEPDPARAELARSLPMHRFDWWATDAPGYPSWAEASTRPTKPGDEELRGLKLSPSTFPPWPTWDMSAAIDHVQVRFGADEVARMKKAAQASIPKDARQQRPISRLDAVLAHMWILIIRARQLQDLDELVYLNITLGIRSRVNPPLPDAFLGSPLMLGYITRTGAEVCSPATTTTTTTIGSVALSIRQMVSLFTPEAVSAYLHDAAHEVCPQRLWQGFIGERNTIVTSWTRAGAYEVDFLGEGVRPRYVQGRMPRMDGVLQVMDNVAKTGDFDVSLCMEREAMGRLLEDEMLGAYER